MKNNSNDSTSEFSAIDATVVTKNKVRKHTILNNPILAGILLPIWGYIFYLFLCGGIGSYIGQLVLGNQDIRVTALFILIGSIFILVLHKAWFKPDFKGFMSLSFFKNKHAMIIIIIFAIVDLVICLLGIFSSGFVIPPFEGIATAIVAAVGEEAAFRVLPISTMMRSYKDRGKYLAAIILPAIIFGLSHFYNYFAGADLTITIVQVLSSLISGIFFGAVYLYTGSIVPTMILHFLHDFYCACTATSSTGLITALSTGDIIQTSVLAIIQIILVVLLLKGHKADVMNTWKDIWHAESIRTISL